MKGANDPVAMFFDHFVSLIVSSGRKGKLLAFGIENSCNIMRSLEGESEPFGLYVLKRLRKELPFFMVGAAKQSLSDIIPMVRNRIWLRGVRLDVLGLTNGPVYSLPQPQSASNYQPKIKLGDLLETSFGNVWRCINIDFNLQNVFSSFCVWLER